MQPMAQERLEVVLQRCEFARDWRRRHIAHRDLQLALSENAVPLAPASRLAVRKALTAIADLMNEVESGYRNSTVAYGLVPPVHNAEALLYVLRDGLEMENRRRKRLESGELDDEDLHPPRAL